MTPTRKTAEAANSATIPAARLLQTELTDEIEFLAARARALGTAQANASLAPFGLKVRSYSVLALASSDANPSQRELAEFLSLDASQIVALVDDLQSRGLVERSTDPNDRRSNAISATAAGRALYRQAHKAARDAEARSLAPLSSTDRETLRRLLRTIAFPPPHPLGSARTGGRESGIVGGRT